MHSLCRPGYHTQLNGFIHTVNVSESLLFYENGNVKLQLLIGSD